MIIRGGQTDQNRNGRFGSRVRELEELELAYVSQAWTIAESSFLEPSVYNMWIARQPL